MDIVASDDAVAVFATLKQLTTEGTTPRSKANAGKQQTDLQRRVFHTLHALLLAFGAAAAAGAGGDGGDADDDEAAREAGLEQLRLCEKGTADAFRRLLAGENFHYLLTSATCTVLADVLVLLLQKLYSKAVADALEEAVKAAQAKSAPRNVRLCAAICVGRALGACGHQLRPLHGEGVSFLAKGLKAPEACVREACVAAVERAVSGCGRYIAAQHKPLFLAVRGLAADKSSDVRAAAAGALGAIAASQATPGGDQAFNAVKLHDIVEALKKGVVDKLPNVVEACARALAGVVALSCPDEVPLASTRHLAGNAAYQGANANARFHLSAKSAAARGTVTPLTNAVDFLVTGITRPGSFAAGVSPLRTQVIWSFCERASERKMRAFVVVCAVYFVSHMASE